MHHSEITMGCEEVGICSLHTASEFDAFLHFSSLKQHHALVDQNGGGSRIQFLRAVELVERDRIPTGRRKCNGEPKVREWIAWVKFNCAAEVPFTLLKIPIAPDFGEGQSAMSLG